MSNVQPGILAEIPRLGRYLFFSLKPGCRPGAVLRPLAEQVDGESVVVGLGQALLQALDQGIEGMRIFPAYAGTGCVVPSTPTALWVWLRGGDRGELLHLSRRIGKILANDFELDRAVDAFQYRDSRDLTGYEDGTENPEGEEAVNAAVVQGHGAGLDGASFVAVQQWLHDLDRFEAKSPAEQDHTIGRRISDNEEIEDASESAHVKRTAQEDFEPEAFVLRRSMPWAEGDRSGLVFVAFGRSFDAFEAQLQRMTGAEDGIVDALFSFTRPLTGSYFWCPPMRDGRLDLSGIGL